MNTLIAQIEKGKPFFEKISRNIIYVLFVTGLSRQCRLFYFRVFFC